MIKLNEIIRKARKKAGKTQLWLAHKAGVTEQTILGLENRKNARQILMLERIFTALSLDVIPVFELERTGKKMVVLDIENFDKHIKPEMFLESDKRTKRMYDRLIKFTNLYGRDKRDIRPDVWAGITLAISILQQWINKKFELGIG